MTYKLAQSSTLKVNYFFECNLRIKSHDEVPAVCVGGSNENTKNNMTSHGDTGLLKLLQLDKHTSMCLPSWGLFLEPLQLDKHTSAACISHHMTSHLRHCSVKSILYIDTITFIMQFLLIVPVPTYSTIPDPFVFS